ncbi:peroxiredoxin [Thiomicrospira microaerophila]|uniref:peroxiredoxin n=1 Tax=Thiomicrospira microaerophila TaxID=406020 RepID=UPI00200C67AD|nr:peroxiredoxin [Thiomicrospira microaerophila]UQB43187.1 peroxiredoxin [Thiomicrospira microaerophila]
MENIKLNEFSLEATPNQTLSLEAFKGRYSVIYFYPKDNTPGCTQEGQDFSELHPEFLKLNAQIFGVSKDSLKQHQNFKQKYAFPFELISDPDEQLCKMFDVIKLKKNFGKEYYGIERSSFLLDPELNPIQAWRKVKVTGHAQAVLDCLKQNV